VLSLVTKLTVITVTLPFTQTLRRTKMKFGFTPEAEILNARLAMLGFVIAVGTYMTTGQIIPGVW
jgi:hypothetical protein